MSVDLGVAKGYIELDLSKMTTAVQTAEKQLQGIERSGKLTESQMRGLRTASEGVGSTFQQAAEKSKALASEIAQCDAKTKVYKVSIDGLNTIIDRSKKEQEQLSTQIEKTRAQYDKSQEKIKEMAESLKGEQKEYKNLVKEADKRKETLGEESAEYQKAQEAADTYKKTLEEHADKYKKTAEKSQTYQNRLQQLQSQHGDLSLEIERSGDKIVEFQTDLNNTESDIRELSSELDDSRNKAKLWGEALQGAGDKLRSSGDKLSSAGRGLTMGITAPLAAAGTASVKFAMDAETSFAKVSTIADENVVSMGNIRTGVKAVSNEMGVAVTDFNEALYQTISATGDTSSAIAYTTIAAKAAKGGFTDTATAVDGLTTIMNSYGLQGAEAMEKVSDQMLVAQNYGKTTFGELASSMGQVVPIASQLNIGTDTLLATLAVLTKNGIGTSEAVTGMKAALSNIIAPTNEASNAAETLGIDFSASALQAKGFSGFMDGVKGALANAAPEYATMLDRSAALTSAMAELEAGGKKSSDEYKVLAQESKTLAGKMELLATASDSPIAGFSTLFGSIEGLNSMMVVTSDSGSKDLEGAMAAMEKSAGATQTAFEKMDATPASKMQKELNKLKNTGIDVGNKLLPLVIRGVEAIGGLVDAFDKLSPAQQDMLINMGLTAAAAGPVISATGGIVKGIGKVTGGIGDMLAKSKGAASAVGSLGADMAGLGAKAATAGGAGGIGVVKGALAALTGPAGIAVLAGAAIIGIATACYAMYEQAKKDDLTKHFGDIKLSAEEVEDVAKRLSTTDWTVRIKTFIEADQKLDELEGNIRTTVGDLNKYDWKVSVGLALTDEEKQAYTRSAEAFVDQCTDYVSQKGYSVNLAIKASFKDGSTTGAGLSAFADSYYSSAQSELETLGAELSQLINDSFANNTFAKNRMNIERIRQQMAEITAEIAQAGANEKKIDYEIELRNIDMNLTAESFQQVNEAINKNNEVIQAEVEKTKATVKQTIYTQYNSLVKSGMSRETAGKIKDKALKDLEADMATSEAEVRLTGITFATDTLEKNYEDSLQKAKPNFTSKLEDIMGQGIASAKAGDFGIFFMDMADSFKSGVDGFEGGQKENIRAMLGELGDQPEALADLAQTFLQAGQEVPKNIADGLSDVYELELMSGNLDHIYQYMGMQLGTSPEYVKMIEEAVASGVQLPEGLTEGISTSSGKVFDATTGTFQKITEATANTLPAILSFLSAEGLKPGDALANALASQFGLVYNNGAWLSLQSSDGLASQLPTVLNTFTDSGITIPNALISSMQGQSSTVMAQAAELVNQLMYANDNERPAIIAALADLGVSGGDTLSTNITAKQSEVSAAATALFQLIGVASETERPGLLEQARSLGINLTDAQISALQSKYGDMDDATRASAANTVTGYNEGIAANAGSTETAVAQWAQASLDALSKTLDEHSPSRKTRISGENTVEGYNVGVKGKQDTSRTIMQSFGEKALKALTDVKIPDSAKKEATAAGTSFVSAISAKIPASSSAGLGIANAAKNGIQSVNSSSSWTWGYDLGNGMANGLWGAIGNIRSAAWSVASAIRAVLHFSRPDVGPLRDYETYMPDMVQGLSKTLARSSPMLIHEVEATADAMAQALKIEPSQDLEMVWAAVDSVGEKFKDRGEITLKMQVQQMDTFVNSATVMSGNLSALQNSVDQLVQETRNTREQDDTVERLVDAIQNITLYATAVFDKRVAGKELAPVIDHNAGASMALKKRGVL